MPRHVDDEQRRPCLRGSSRATGAFLIGALALLACADGDLDDADTGAAAEAAPSPPPLDAAATGADTGAPTTCGDGVCERPEQCLNCAQDCGRCPPACGDDLCEEPEETCAQCPRDCGECPPVCGDGMCVAAETCESCEDDCGRCPWPAEWAALEDELLRLVNAERATATTCGGAQVAASPPLTMQPALRDAARTHSQDMATNNYFAEQSPDGRGFADRAATAGYDGRPDAQSIRAATETAEATFRQAIGAGGSCRTLTNGAFTEVGIGYARDDASDFVHYWTLVFGSR